MADLSALKQESSRLGRFVKSVNINHRHRRTPAFISLLYRSVERLHSLYGSLDSSLLQPLEHDGSLEGHGQLKELLDGD